MARRAQRFTIYDALEHKGYFDSNPANVDARDSEGASIFVRAEYPKMLYHPEGETFEVVPPEAIATPFGPKWVGEQRALIHRIVGSAAEEKELVAAGWHTHPAKAIAASGKSAPSMGPAIEALAKDAEIEDLRRQIELLRSQQAAQQTGVPAPSVGTSASDAVAMPSEDPNEPAPLAMSAEAILARELAPRKSR